MSFKAKDLKYEQNEPAFLRRMRGNISSATDDPDRRSIAAAGRGFARKSKKPGDDDDDAPTYVVEGSEATLSRDEAEALLKPKDATADVDVAKKDSPELDAAVRDGDGSAADIVVRRAQQVADAGLQSKKRKAVKIVDEEPEVEIEATKSVKVKPKKKAKAIKLQFDD